MDATTPDTLTTADALTCRLTLELGDDFEAEFPELLFGEDLPGLICTGLDEKEIKQSAGRKLIRTYELEPEYAGTFTLPTLEVYYHRREEVKESLLTTEPIPITVKDTPVAAADLELKPIRGLMTVERIEGNNVTAVYWRGAYIFPGLQRPSQQRVDGKFLDAKTLRFEVWDDANQRWAEAVYTLNRDGTLTGRWSSGSVVATGLLTKEQ